LITGSPGKVLAKTGVLAVFMAVGFMGFSVTVSISVNDLLRHEPELDLALSFLGVGGGVDHVLHHALGGDAAVLAAQVLVV
jgi:hypothetical protein